MNRRLLAVAFLLVPLGIWAGPVVQAPLLFVRVQGPAGMTVSFLEGPNQQRKFDAPVAVGLRPGMIHRLKIDNLPELPGISLYPTLEVQGTLRLSPRLKASDYPVPIGFTDADIAHALGGTMVTKVLLLEDPDRAIPLPPLPGVSPDFEISPKDDPMEFAKSLGRAVVIMRFGRRDPDAKELANVRPGHILYPGETSLPALPPPQPRIIGYTFGPNGPCPVFQTMLPEPWVVKKVEECIRDGGDNGDRMHIDAGGQIRGLDPADSAAQYIDSQGRKHLTITNEVCLFVPRFIAVRHLLPPAIFDGVRQPGRVANREIGEKAVGRQEPKGTRQVDDAVALRGRERLNANIVAMPSVRLRDFQHLGAIEMNMGNGQYIGTDRLRSLEEKAKAKLARQIDLAHRLSRHMGTKATIGGDSLHAIGVVDGIGQVTGSLETRTHTYFCKAEAELPEQPLQVLKWASAESAQIGDVVTFFIRYNNLGGKPIRDIAVADSLTARLEYIPGSAKSDREAVFVTQDNEAGSVILRWEFRDALPPGQHGVVSFQARVR